MAGLPPSGSGRAKSAQPPESNSQSTPARATRSGGSVEPALLPNASRKKRPKLIQPKETHPADHDSSQAAPPTPPATAAAEGPDACTPASSGPSAQTRPTSGTHNNEMDVDDSVAATAQASTNIRFPVLQSERRKKIAAANHGAPNRLMDTHGNDVGEVPPATSARVKAKSLHPTRTPSIPRLKGVTVKKEKVFKDPNSDLKTKLPIKDGPPVRDDVKTGRFVIVPYRVDLLSPADRRSLNIVPDVDEDDDDEDEPINEENVYSIFASDCHAHGSSHTPASVVVCLPFSLFILPETKEFIENTVPKKAEEHPSQQALSQTLAEYSIYYPFIHDTVNLWILRSLPNVATSHQYLTPYRPSHFEYPIFPAPTLEDDGPMGDHLLNIMKDREFCHGVPLSVRTARPNTTTARNENLHPSEHVPIGVTHIIGTHARTINSALRIASEPHMKILPDWPNGHTAIQRAAHTYPSNIFTPAVQSTFFEAFNKAYGVKKGTIIYSDGPTGIPKSGKTSKYNPIPYRTQLGSAVSRATNHIAANIRDKLKTIRTNDDRRSSLLQLARAQEADTMSDASDESDTSNESDDLAPDTAAKWPKFTMDFLMENIDQVRDVVETYQNRGFPVDDDLNGLWTAMEEQVAMSFPASAAAVPDPEPPTQPDLIPDEVHQKLKEMTEEAELDADGLQPSSSFSAPDMNYHNPDFMAMLDAFEQQQQQHHHGAFTQNDPAETAASSHPDPATADEELVDLDMDVEMAEPHPLPAEQTFGQSSRALSPDGGQQADTPKPDRPMPPQHPSVPGFPGLPNWDSWDIAVFLGIDIIQSPEKREQCPKVFYDDAHALDEDGEWINPVLHDLRDDIAWPLFRPGHQHPYFHQVWAVAYALFLAFSHQVPLEHAMTIAIADETGLGKTYLCSMVAAVLRWYQIEYDRDDEFSPPIFKWDRQGFTYPHPQTGVMVPLSEAYETFVALGYPRVAKPHQVFRPWKTDKRNPVGHTMLPVLVVCPAAPQESHRDSFYTALDPKYFKVEIYKPRDLQNHEAKLLFWSDKGAKPIGEPVPFLITTEENMTHEFLTWDTLPSRSYESCLNLYGPKRVPDTGPQKMFSIMIFDEAHKYRYRPEGTITSRIKFSVYAETLAKRAQWTWLMSATLVWSSPIDLISIFFVGGRDPTLHPISTLPGYNPIRKNHMSLHYEWVDLFKKYVKLETTRSNLQRRGKDMKKRLGLEGRSSYPILSDAHTTLELDADVFERLGVAPNESTKAWALALTDNTSDVLNSILIPIRAILRPSIIKRTRNHIFPFIDPKIPVQIIKPVNVAIKTITTPLPPDERENYETHTSQNNDGENVLPNGFHIVSRQLLIDPYIAIHKRAYWESGPTTKVLKVHEACQDFMAPYAHLPEELQPKGILYLHWTNQMQSLFMLYMAYLGTRVRVLDGNMTPAQRAQTLAEFNRDKSHMSTPIYGYVKKEECTMEAVPTRWLLISDAISVGMNLQRASGMVLVDLPWSHASYTQIIGRIIRIGQTRDCVIYRIMIQDTVEQFMLHTIDRRGDWASKMDDENPEQYISSEKKTVGESEWKTIVRAPTVIDTAQDSTLTRLGYARIWHRPVASLADEPITPPKSKTQTTPGPSPARSTTSTAVDSQATPKASATKVAATPGTPLTQEPTSSQVDTSSSQVSTQITPTPTHGHPSFVAATPSSGGPTVIVDSSLVTGGSDPTAAELDPKLLQPPGSQNAPPSPDTESSPETENVWDYCPTDYTLKRTLPAVTKLPWFQHLLSKDSDSRKPADDRLSWKIPDGVRFDDALCWDMLHPYIKTMNYQPVITFPGKDKHGGPLHFQTLSTRNEKWALLDELVCHNRVRLHFVRRQPGHMPMHSDEREFFDQMLETGQNHAPEQFRDWIKLVSLALDDRGCMTVKSINFLDGELKENPGRFPSFPITTPEIAQLFHNFRPADTHFPPTSCHDGQWPEFKTITVPLLPEQRYTEKKQKGNHESKHPKSRATVDSDADDSASDNPPEPRPAADKPATPPVPATSKAAQKAVFNKFKQDHKTGSSSKKVATGQKRPRSKSPLPPGEANAAEGEAETEGQEGYKSMESSPMSEAPATP